MRRQIKKHLLCAECEDRFNKQGEGWVLRHCYKQPGIFPLQQILLAAKPRYPMRSGMVYYAADVPAIDWQRLVYFAISIVWRAGVDDWDQPEGRYKLPLSMAEADREALRQYLLDEITIPHNVLVMISVAPSQTPAVQSMWSPTEWSCQGFPGYLFSVPGILFQMLIAEEIPAEWYEQGCLVHGTGHPLQLLHTDAAFVGPRNRYLRTAVPSNLLIAEVEKKYGIKLPRRSKSQSQALADRNGTRANRAGRRPKAKS
jgi:hypothetical protein